MHMTAHVHTPYVHESLFFDPFPWLSLLWSHAKGPRAGAAPRVLRCTAPLQPACRGGEAVTLGGDPVAISVVSLDYSGRTECTWVITGVPPIELNFTSFETRSSDYVKVYKGNGTNGRLLKKYSGSVLPPPLRSTAGTFTVTFTSGSHTRGKGFGAVLQAALGAPLASAARVSPALAVLPCAP
jgi:hypothetical protein